MLAERSEPAPHAADATPRYLQAERFIRSVLTSRVYRVCYRTGLARGQPP
jgi:hypothetical protein